MGCICSDYDFDYINNSYYKIDLFSDYLIVFNLQKNGKFIPNTFMTLNSTDRKKMRDLIEEYTFSKVHSMAMKSEQKNQELINNTRKDLEDCFLESGGNKNDLCIVEKIPIHYIHINQKIFNDRRMDIVHVGDYLKFYVNHCKKIQEKEKTQRNFLIETQPEIVIEMVNMKRRSIEENFQL